jgi:hypothetical protein
MSAANRAALPCRSQRALALETLATNRIGSEVTMDGVDKPSTLSFLAGERFVEFKNKKWGTHDIVKVLLGLIRTELSKALKPPKV